MAFIATSFIHWIGVWLGHQTDEDVVPWNLIPFILPVPNRSAVRSVSLQPFADRKECEVRCWFLTVSVQKGPCDWSLSGLLSVKPLVSSSATVSWSNKRWFITNIGRAFRYRPTYLWPTAKPRFTRDLRKGSRNWKRIEAYYIGLRFLWLSIVRVLYYSTKVMFIIE